MTQSVISRDRMRMTPFRLRAWSVVLAALLLASALVGLTGAGQLIGSTNDIADNTGPILIETQGLVASIAEADSANTAVFLSGVNEDRQQRRLFETALERAPRQIEEISARLGDDDESHEALQELGSQLTRYAGLAEQARTQNLARIDGATETLQQTLDLAAGPNGMLSNVAVVNERSQARFDDEPSVFIWLGVTLGLLVIALLALIIAQFRLRKLTKRLLNIGLIAAFGLTALALVWLVVASGARFGDLTEATDEGFDAIELTAQLQTEAFAFKTREAESVIGTSSFGSEDRQAATDQVNTLIAQVVDDADSAREVAAAEELQVRWDRYLSSSAQIADALDSGQTEIARVIAVTAGNRDFNGFNTTVESVLLRNRDQFDASVASAANRLRWLRWVMLGLPLIAILFVLLGYQPRIDEYY